MNSMTGYGRAQLMLEKRDVLVEIKSVNHRFFEFSARVPRSYNYLEEKLKGLVYQTAVRGKIDISVSITAREGASTEVTLNQQLAQNYVVALRELGHKLHLQDDLTLTSLTRFGDIFTVRKTEEDADEIWDAVRPVAEEALAHFNQMRAVEGQKLKEDILARLASIEALVAQVEERSPQTLAEYRQRLFARLQEVLGDSRLDEQRILTEAAIFADKTAVAEETVRLHSHLSQMRSMLAGPEAVGRKLDFLVQEMNREVNTIGSKGQDIEIARIVVELKGEIEKIREQVQNIE